MRRLITVDTRHSGTPRLSQLGRNCSLAMLNKNSNALNYVYDYVYHYYTYCITHTVKQFITM